MEVKPKPRPDDVPVGNVKRKSGAVTESIRPKTIEKRPRDRAKEFGDLEFRWSLDSELIKNPIARLGFKNSTGSDKVTDFNNVEGYVDHIMSTPMLKEKVSDDLQIFNDKELKEELLYYYNKALASVPKVFDNAFYIYSRNTPSQAKLLGDMAVPKNKADEALPDDIFVDTDVASPRVWAHEMTHRGFDRLVEYKNQIGAEEFGNKYGKQALETLEQISKDVNKDEFFTEYFDFVDDTWNYPNLENMGRDDKEKFLDENSLKNIEIFQRQGPGVFGKKNPRFGGVGYLIQAAEDILKEVEPPRATPYGHLSFMGRLRKKLGFAKGGTVMDEQMKMAFMMDEGGLKDDGMEKDPVSGNEVPSGSMAEEVRDNIPAQLSEGEYVVPADVVRYYGVKFFEDLRDRAKMGLAEMEANGRIGGEPVPAGGPVNDEELSPQEMQAIQEMMGMAEGGDIQNPYMQQQLLYSQPRPAPIDDQKNTVVDITNPVVNQMPVQNMAMGGKVKGYAPGGLEQSFLNTGQQAVNRGFVGFPLGATIFPSEKTGQTVLGSTGTQVATTGAIDTAIKNTGTTGADTSLLTTVTLYGPNGEIVTLTLPTDQARYDELIAQGYSTTPPVAGEPVVKDGDDDDDDDDKPKTDPNSWMDKFSYDDFGKLGNETSDMLKKAPVGGAIGAFINGNRAAQTAANIIIMRANGENTTELEEEWKKFVDSDLVLKNLPKELINGDRFARDIVLNNPGMDIGLFKDSKDIFGNDIFKNDNDFNNFMQETAPPGMTFDPNITSTTTNNAGETVTVQGGYTREGSAAPTSSPIPPARPSNISGGSSSGSSGSSGQDNNPNIGAFSSNIASSGVSQATQTIQDSIDAAAAREQAETDASAAFDKSDAAEKLGFAGGIGINKGGLMAIPKKKKKRQPKKGGLAGRK